MPRVALVSCRPAKQLLACDSCFNRPARTFNRRFFSLRAISTDTTALYCTYTAPNPYCTQPAIPEYTSSVEPSVLSVAAGSSNAGGTLRACTGAERRERIVFCLPLFPFDFPRPLPIHSSDLRFAVLPCEPARPLFRALFGASLMRFWAHRPLRFHAIAPEVLFARTSELAFLPLESVPA